MTFHIRMWLATVTVRFGTLSDHLLARTGRGARKFRLATTGGHRGRYGGGRADLRR